MSSQNVGQCVAGLRLVSKALHDLANEANTQHSGVLPVSFGLALKLLQKEVEEAIEEVEQ